DRVGVMYAGDMAEVAPARIIFKAPLHPYTSGLMKAVPSVQMDAKELYSIRGSVPNLITPPPGCRFHPRCDYAREYCTRVKPELVEIEPDHFVSCHMVAKAEGYVHG
ncbi:MAG: ABC transporter ATP-binding protein, partial [Thermoplasmata archaeon]